MYLLPLGELYLLLVLSPALVSAAAPVCPCCVFLRGPVEP